MPRPFGVWVAVEDDEGALVEAEAIEIAVELGQALVERIGAAGMADLELDCFPLLGASSIRAAVRPADQDVDPAGADSVFTIDVAAAVDDPVREAHEDQLAGGLIVELRLSH